MFEKRISENEWRRWKEEGEQGIYKAFPFLPGREERKLYALDSQVSGLSRRVTQTGVTAARFIVFVNLGRVTSRRGSGYHPPRRRIRHDVRRATHPPPPPSSSYPPPLSLFRCFIPPIARPSNDRYLRRRADRCEEEKKGKKRKNATGSRQTPQPALDESAPSCAPLPDTVLTVCNGGRHRGGGGEALGNGSFSFSWGGIYLLLLLFAIRFGIFGNFPSIE